MASIALGLGRSGLQEWLLQRISAVIILSYCIYLFSFCVFHTAIDFIAWKMFFGLQSVKFFTLITVIAILVHAWIGLWTVTTDYIKPVFLRLITQIIINLTLVVEVLFAVKILWS